MVQPWRIRRESSLIEVSSLISRVGLAASTAAFDTTMSLSKSLLDGSRNVACRFRGLEVALCAACPRRLERM